MGLLGNVGQWFALPKQQNQYNTLLGIDPQARKWNAIGGFLEGAGVGLMTGDWAKGLEASNAADQRFQQQAMQGFQAKQQAEDKAYGREQDAKTWNWREKQAAQEQARWEAEQARLAQAQRDQAAWQNLVRQNTVKGWQETDALKQGQTNAVNAWTNNFKSQGGDLFSPEMQTGLRAQGVQGVDPMDTVKFRQALPLMQGGAIGSAYDVLATPTPQPNAPVGYRYTTGGNLEAITGGPADPRIKNPPNNATAVPTKNKSDAISIKQAYDNINGALENYKDLVSKTGVSIFPGQENDQISQERTNLQLQLKELYNLGVLNGPDLSLMEQMIFDPQTHWYEPIGSAGKLYSAAGGYNSTSIKDRATSSISNLQNMLKKIMENKTKGIIDAPVISQAGEVPNGLTPQEWNAMTEEERNLWR